MGFQRWVYGNWGTIKNEEIFGFILRASDKFFMLIVLAGDEGGEFFFLFLFYFFLYFIFCLL